MELPSTHYPLPITQMKIQLVEIEMDITAAPGELAMAIESKLQEWGEPLRWAITAVDRETNIAQIEAIAIAE
ncbi:hypothetical protein [Chamaesiphon polymorphus]|uniref:hypothetical protein n=1 Tax=Chamaesiphon polymorphus TaxID=2107691 RepID=UPI0011B1DBEB|nr:hypothetical protein [Chamaesiphon polymorphus]